MAERIGWDDAIAVGVFAALVVPTTEIVQGFVASQERALQPSGWQGWFAAHALFFTPLSAVLLLACAIATRAGDGRSRREGLLRTYRGSISILGTYLAIVAIGGFAAQLTGGDSGSLSTALALRLLPVALLALPAVGVALGLVGLSVDRFSPIADAGPPSWARTGGQFSDQPPLAPEQAWRDYYGDPTAPER